MILNSLTSLIYRVAEEPVAAGPVREYSNAAYAILCPIVITVVTTMLTVIIAENLWRNGDQAQDVALDVAVIIAGGISLTVSGTTIYNSITYFKSPPYYCCNSAPTYPDHTDVIAYVVGLNSAGEMV